MPESQRASARFVPVSEEDFNQYAKNLAWLTGLKLSAAKETLAKLYGYPSLYEMRKILERGALPLGPFSPSPIPSFLPEEEDPHSSENCLTANSAEQQLRRTRLRELMSIESLSQLRQVALLEVGIFCSPKLHKELFKSARIGILAVESGDLAALKDFLLHHWPVGFWGLLDWLYGAPMDLDESGLKRLEVLSVKAPSEQRKSLWSFKAAQIYKRLTLAIDAGELAEYWDSYDMPIPEKSQSNPGMYEFSFLDFKGPDPEIDNLLEVLDTEELEDEVIDAVFSALEANSLDPVKHPKLKEALSEQQLSALNESIYASRYAQLKTYCSAVTSCPGLVEELIIGSDVLPMLSEQTNIFSYISLSEADGFMAGDFRGIQILELEAKFFQRDFGSREPATAVGAATGYLLVPYDSKYSCSNGLWFDALDSVSAMLNDVWKALKTDYFPRQGMRGIEGFRQENPGSTIAVLSFELLPEFRGKGYGPYLMNAISSGLRDHPFSSLDYSWYHMADNMVLDSEKLKDWDTHPAESKIRSLGEPAVFVLPVEGADVSDRVVRPQLSSSVGRLKKYAKDPLEIRKRKLMAHFKAMEPKLSREDPEAQTSIVCYDHYEWPNT